VPSISVGPAIVKVAVLQSKEPLLILNWSAASLPIFTVPLAETVAPEIFTLPLKDIVW
jgi:hypothetical protein